MFGSFSGIIILRFGFLSNQTENPGPSPERKKENPNPRNPKSGIKLKRALIHKIIKARLNWESSVAKRQQREEHQKSTTFTWNKIRKPSTTTTTTMSSAQSDPDLKSLKPLKIMSSQNAKRKGKKINYLKTTSFSL